MDEGAAIGDAAGVAAWPPFGDPLACAAATPGRAITLAKASNNGPASAAKIDFAIRRLARAVTPVIERLRLRTLEN